MSVAQKCLVKEVLFKEQHFLERLLRNQHIQTLEEVLQLIVVTLRVSESSVDKVIKELSADQILIEVRVVRILLPQIAFEVKHLFHSYLD